MCGIKHKHNTSDIMKRFALSLAAPLICLVLQAQHPWDTNFFNHLSVGVNAGTPGVGADVAMPVCKFIQVRAGFVKMPDFNINASLDASETQYFDASGTLQQLPEGKLKIQGKPKLANGIIMLDLLPISSFHITVGAYFGGGDIIEMYNREDGALSIINEANDQIAQWNAQNPGNPQKPIGLELGDYLLTPDADGNVRATFSTKKFRPYAGLGFGRAVPRKRIGFRTDIGCMFWGKPTIKCNGETISASDVGGDEGKIIRAMSKIKIYPCISFRLCGRIF